MKLLRVLDPHGSKTRKAHRLRRRQYVSVGPDFCWHTDGYDKLKPYGLPKHGCIDGFSRKILWLKVSRSQEPTNSKIGFAHNIFEQNVVLKMG